ASKSKIAYYLLPLLPSLALLIASYLSALLSGTELNGVHWRCTAALSYFLSCSLLAGGIALSFIIHRMEPGLFGWVLPMALVLIAGSGGMMVFLGQRIMHSFLASFIALLVGANAQLYLPIKDKDLNDVGPRQNYNFREIRKELEGKGHKFRSQSDTEVIVHLYEELGTKCLERLNGMFAFALWDGKQKSLFLARDRTGKKPLHYCLHRGHFLFASEIKALLQHRLVSRELDLKSLNKYLAYEYVPAPHTIFKAIKKLEPGHYLLFRGGAAVTSQYWDIPMEYYPISDRTEAQDIDELKGLLERAVTARLEAADVPVGLFVSGGLDSGVVAAMARR